MKEDNKIVVLTTVCVVLVVLWVVGLFTSSQAQASRLRSVPLFEHFSEEQLREVALGSHEFTYEDDNWYSAGVPARADRLEAFFLAVEDSKILRRVSSDVSDLEKYGLAPGRLAVFTFEDAASIGFLLGTAVDAAEQTYAMLSDVEHQEVFTLDNSIDFYFRQPASYWTDLRLFPQGPENHTIISVEIDTEDEAFTLLRSLDSEGEELWIFADDATGEIDGSKANGIVNTLLRLEARDIEPTTERLEEERIHFILSSEERSYELRVFETEDVERTILRSSESAEYQYLVSEAVRDRLLRDRDYFLVAEDEDSP